MIRQTVWVCAAVVAIGWASPAFAFEPIAFADVPGLVGKPIYAGSTVAVGPGWAYAGEPVTLVSAFANTRGKVPTYSYIRVRTEDGKEAEVQIRYFSRAPLQFNLRSPGTAKQLVLAILADASEIPAKLHELRDRFHYDISRDDQPDEHHQADSMAESFTFQRRLLHQLVYGGSTAQIVLRDDGLRWIAAGDESLLAWYTAGVPDKKLKAKLENADKALSILDGVASLGSRIAQLAKDKVDRPWRKGLDDVPADKLDKLDADKIAEIDKGVQNGRKQVQAEFALAAKFKARAK